MMRFSFPPSRFRFDVFFVSLLSITIARAGPLQDSAPRDETADPDVLFEKAFYTEETLGDLEGAMAIYRQIIKGEKARERLAAEATFRLALCQAKAGEAEASLETFQDLVTKHPDEREVAARARRELAKRLSSDRHSGRPSAGAEVHRTLEYNARREGSALDLDSGAIHAELGESLPTSGADVTARRRERGDDLLVSSGTFVSGLVGFDLAVSRVDSTAWTMDADALALRIPDGASRGFVPLRADDLPASFLFRTREGSTGLLEITGMSGPMPRTVALRYRLFAPSRAARTGDPAAGAKLLPALKTTFAEAIRAIADGDAKAAVAALDSLKENLPLLEARIEGTDAAVPIRMAIEQVRRLDAAVRIGDLERAGRIVDSLALGGPELEKMIAEIGATEKSRSNPERVVPEDSASAADRVAIRLVATEGESGATDEFPDTAGDGTEQQTIRVFREAVIDGRAVEAATVRKSRSGSGWEVEVELSEEGGAALGAFSEKHTGRRLAIVVGGRLVAAPTIRSRVAREVVITGNFTFGEAQLLCAALHPGSD